MADDQRFDLAGIGADELDVVQQRFRRVAEVEHHRALFVCRAAIRSIQRKAPLIVQGATIIGARRRLDLDPSHLARTQEQIVRTIDEHAHAEPIDNRRLDRRGACKFHAREFRQQLTLPRMPPKPSGNRVA